MVSLEITRNDFLIAKINYHPGFLVEIQVSELFVNQKIEYHTSHHHGKLSGYWDQVLDQYFNEWIFESRSDMFPDEAPRSGCAREHKNLFLAAARALEKDLGPHGYKFNVSFN